MRIETDAELFGYPALAIVLFLIAAACALWLLISISLSDLPQRRRRDSGEVQVPPSPRGWRRRRRPGPPRPRRHQLPAGLDVCRREATVNRRTTLHQRIPAAPRSLLVAVSVSPTLGGVRPRAGPHAPDDVGEPGDDLVLRATTSWRSVPCPVKPTVAGTSLIECRRQRRAVLGLREQRAWGLLERVSGSAANQPPRSPRDRRGDGPPDGRVGVVHREPELGPHAGHWLPDQPHLRSRSSRWPVSPGRSSRLEHALHLCPGVARPFPARGVDPEQCRPVEGSEVVYLGHQRPLRCIRRARTRVAVADRVPGWPGTEVTSHPSRPSGPQAVRDGDDLVHRQPACGEDGAFRATARPPQRHHTHPLREDVRRALHAHACGAAVCVRRPDVVLRSVARGQREDVQRRPVESSARVGLRPPRWPLSRRRGFLRDDDRPEPPPPTTR